MGRAFCLYRYHSFTHVPKEHRQAALANLIEVWSPFSETAYYVSWRAGHAMVWFWDAQRIDFSLLGEAALGAAFVLSETLPETVLLPAKNNGIYLQVCQEGTELQYWHDGLLLESQWYLARPSLSEQASFLRSIQYSANDATSIQTVDLDWLEQPWSGDVSWSSWLTKNEWRMGAVAVAVLLLILVWQEGRYWQAVVKTTQQKSQIVSLSDSLEPLINARNKIQVLQSWNQAVAAEIGQPQQIRLMNSVDSVLPSAAAAFIEWRYQRGQLEVLIDDPAAQPVQYVKSLQSLPVFSSVRTEKGRDDGQIRLVAEVR